MTLSAEQNLTSDMFEVDKRLGLKPVVDFNSYLANAFGDGPCTCSRCHASGGDESGYEHQHTFVIDGRTLNRRFASTAGSDVLNALKKAWLSYTKTDLPALGALELTAVKGFVEPQLHARVLPLFLASGLVREVDGQWLLQVQAGD
ncbi:hypothetical protein [Pseudomonas rubra]|uniref:Uncharacterized protein n=1 Tax=Pseudomonas rubra TaxID=2942627 RepID=A0ABT5P9Z0_9PSED|nr:hypothetical protein [Pseudomonas rubra]MDD1015116.1 hypothetical protein [Pseudomonas rubra]MDD1037695.1 hypothetical protein [Pseudomonas rubra]MDD1157385.1 hypothetical protein [Pseudomonas rubra]